MRCNKIDDATGLDITHIGDCPKAEPKIKSTWAHAVYALMKMNKFIIVGFLFIAYLVAALIAFVVNNPDYHAHQWRALLSFVTMEPM